VQNNTNSPTPLDVGPSLAQTRINLCVFLHHHMGKGARIQVLLVGVTPGWKTPTIGAPGWGPACSFTDFPIPFQMATLISPIPCSTVIWFGSLEFMSTGSGYDMILLLVKGPGGARLAPARLRAPRRPRHHASLPKKRHGQRHHHPSASSRLIVHARQEVT